MIQPAVVESQPSLDTSIWMIVWMFASLKLSLSKLVTQRKWPLITSISRQPLVCLSEKKDHKQRRRLLIVCAVRRWATWRWQSGFAAAWWGRWWATAWAHTSSAVMKISYHRLCSIISLASWSDRSTILRGKLVLAVCSFFSFLENELFLSVFQIYIYWEKKIRIRIWIQAFDQSGSKSRTVIKLQL